MSKQKFVTYSLYLLMLTLGAAGIVTAFNGGASQTSQPEVQPSAAAQSPAANAGAQTVEDILDYDWHEYGPFRTFQTADGRKIIIDRLHVYFKTEDDLFSGRITALSGGVMDHVGLDGEPLNVQFIQNNAAVATTTLNSDGTFEIRGLASGPYDIRVLSRNSLYTSSFVLSTREDLILAGYSDGEVDRVYQAERMRPFQLEAAGCIPSDYALAVELLTETFEFSQKADPPVKFPGFRRLHIPKETYFDAAEGGTSMLRHTVRLDENGVLHGQLRKPIDLPTKQQVGIKHIGGIEVFFLQDGQVVTRLFTDEAGKFDVPGLTPGNFSVVARSPYGVGVMGVRVIEFEYAAARLNLNQKDLPASIESESDQPEAAVGVADPQSSTSAAHYTTTVSSLLQPEGTPSLSLDMSLANPFELPVPPPEEDEDAPPPAAGGGGGGAGGGGGFFFPPFWWENDDPVSPIAPAAEPPGPSGPI